MPVGDSLFVAGLALDVREARLALAGLLATNSADPLDVRTGILFTGDTQLLSGTATTSPSPTIAVDGFHFVSSKGSTNGPYVGCATPTPALPVPAAPALGQRRMDLVWVRQNDAQAVVAADASTAGELGVTMGAATVSPSPAKPDLPAGAVEVGTILWDSSSTVATNSNAAQCTLATTGRWTVTRGAPIPVRDVAERNGLTTRPGLMVLRLDKPGLIQRHDGAGWRGRREGRGTFAGTTNSSGQLNVPHGLPFTPEGVNPTINLAVQGPALEAISSTVFRIRVNDSAGSAQASTAVTVSWSAWEAES